MSLLSSLPVFRSGSVGRNCPEAEETSIHLMPSLQVAIKDALILLGGRSVPLKPIHTLPGDTRAGIWRERFKLCDSNNIPFPQNIGLVLCEPVGCLCTKPKLLRGAMKALFRPSLMTWAALRTDEFLLVASCPAQYAPCSHDVEAVVTECCVPFSVHQKPICA